MRNILVYQTAKMLIILGMSYALRKVLQDQQKENHVPAQ